MSRLHQALKSRSPRENLWYSNRHWWTTNQVVDASVELASLINGPKIALAFPQSMDLALGLLAVDGLCEQVLLVPTSWDQTTLDQYLSRTGIDYVLTSREDLTGSSVYKTDPGSFLANRIKCGEHKKLNNVDTCWIIPTSGTTGSPKLVKHTLSSLTRTVKENQSKGREYIWGMLYELGRFAGLQVFLQSILGGSRIVFPDRNTKLDDTVKILTESGCNALSATPTLWRRLMMTESASKLPLQLITLGGEISDKRILNALATRYPNARIVHIYASTEAGVGFSVTDGIAGFPASFLSSPLKGVELKVDDGILWLRPSTGKQTFVGESTNLSDEEGWINSGDRVDRQNERYYFLGRSNGAINVGGNKVFPESVENIIREVDGVLLVMVKAKANPFMGSLVEAIVKPDSKMDLNLLKSSISKHCKSNLAPYEVPAIISWTEDMHTNEAGKIIRT